MAQDNSSSSGGALRHQKVGHPWIRKENISYESSFSSSLWFFWYTGQGPPMTSTMWSHSQPHWVGPSWYLSQAQSISSLSQHCWLWTKETMSQSYMVALLWGVYISEALRSSLPPSLYLFAVRKDETNKCRKIKRQGESIKCIPGPAIAWSSQSFTAQLIPQLLHT